MIGIENAKKLFKWGADVQKKVATMLADGKITALEAFQLVPELSQIPDVIASGPEALAELKDADYAERAEIDEYVVNELGVADANVEDFVSTVVDWGVATLQMAVSAKKVFSPKGGASDPA